MRRLLLQSAAFVWAARRLVKKHPSAAPALRAALEALAADAFNPALKTHKLKGELAGSWACSAGYDLRIDYRKDPLPPLRGDDAEWAHALLQQAGLRGSEG